MKVLSHYPKRLLKQSETDGSMRKKMCLSKNDLISINRLSVSGFTLQDAMDILEEKHNMQCFNQIRRRLDAGEKMPVFFPQYCPSAYRGYFSGFICYMPFADALDAAVHIVAEEDKAKADIVRGMLYPCLLFLGMLAGIYLFATLVLPSMISLLAGFQMSGENYQIMQEAVKKVSAGLLIFSAAAALCAVTALSSPLISRTYRFVSAVFPNAVLVQYASSQFTRFFVECQRRNVPTIEAMQILQMLKQKPLVSYIASRLNQSLDTGYSLQSAVRNAGVEASLVRFFKIASYASSTEEMMNSYLKMVHERTLHQIAVFSHIVQIVCYSLVGIVIIFVYRILMMPMAMLQNL